MNPALANMSQMQRDNVLIRGSQKANLLITLMVLYDKFHFSVDDMRKFMGEFDELLDSYDRDYISALDLEGILRDECGIEIKF